MRKNHAQLKDASTQTFRYVEHMPLPIIVDIKTEIESDEEEIDVDDMDYGNHNIVIESLKIELDEYEPSSVPVDEYIFDQKMNPYFERLNVKKRLLEQTKENCSKINAKRPKTNKAKKTSKVKKRKKSMDKIDCQLCNFTCKITSQFKRHMLSHTGEKPHKCVHCDKQFAQKTDLHRHMIVNHAAHYDFHCSSCGRGFSDTESTKKHEQKCQTKRFVCDLCNYVTFSKGNLLLHNRKHTGERPYACGSCDKRFTRVAHLNQHVKLHSNQFEMHCSLCGRGFSDETERQKHQLTCKNRMFQCHMCRDIHHRMDNLRRHIKFTHMGEKEIMCEYCSKLYPEKSSLTKHIKLKHPERL